MCPSALAAAHLHGLSHLPLGHPGPGLQGAHACVWLRFPLAHHSCRKSTSCHQRCRPSSPPVSSASPWPSALRRALLRGPSLCGPVAAPQGIAQGQSPGP